MQLLIVGFGNEHRVIVEKMDFLLVTHADVGMPAQKIMQRGRAGFLRTGQNEIEPLDFATLGSEQRHRVVILLTVVLVSMID